MDAESDPAMAFQKLTTLRHHKIMPARDRKLLKDDLNGDTAGWTSRSPLITSIFILMPFVQCIQTAELGALPLLISSDVKSAVQICLETMSQTTAAKALQTQVNEI